MNISITRIVNASIEILNQEGLNGLTMRKIADKLQIAAPSLYFHVKDKQQLYALITERICEIILNQITPQDSLRTICLTARKEYQAVNHSPQLFVVSPPLTENRIALIDIVFDKLRELGVADEYLMVSGNLLQNYMLAFVTDEKIWENKSEATGNMPFELSSINMDQQFEFGLQVIFKGLQASS